MNFYRLKTWFVALMLVIFAGQTVAALAMPCPAMADASRHDMAAMEHDAPMDHMSMSHAHDVALKDCCKLPGHCAAGNCLSAGFTGSFDFAPTGSATKVADHYLAALPASQISSLFRPPIFR